MLPEPVLSFSDLPLSPQLLEVVRELGFEAPTPIQARSIPLLLEGRDLIGQSSTGSGKTAAFGLPLLQKLELADGKPRSLQSLILCPTRELCTQVAREVRRLGRRHAGLQVLVLSGGQPIGPQLEALERGVHVVVGTPGRVLDHLGRGTLRLDRVATLVLDEADRMLDMGFEEDMEQILSALPRERQTVLFSATFPEGILQLSQGCQRDPAQVVVGEDGGQAVEIRQLACEVPSEPEARFEALLRVLRETRPESALVFCNLKATVTTLARELTRNGLSAAALHGDLEQFVRDRVMARFRNRSIRFLIATDVAARGIDVENLEAVICFDLPPQPEVYQHRVGRTGRAGREGLSISFCSNRDRHRLEAIRRFTGLPIPLQSVDKLTAQPQALPEAPPEAAMETLSISGGRKDKVRPGDILGAITGEAGGIAAVDVGKIEIHDRFTYVAISRQLAPLVLHRLRNGTIKGRRFRIELVR